MIRVTLGFACVLAVACGGQSINRDDTLRRLSDAIQAPVSSPEEAAQSSRLVEQVVEEGMLEDMTRQEVSAAIGRGDDCSRHPRCAEAGFEDDDWFYNVGQMGEGATGALPILIVGFDRFGKVTSTWNLRVHDDPG
jgi:hypothetical protein